MTKTNGTITTLLICLMILLWACSTAGPLLAGKYDDGQVKFLSRISTTDIGQKLINHYSKQILILDIRFLGL